MNYLSWDQKTIADLSEKNVADMYDHGYVFTRTGKGAMQKTRSARIDLSAFELSSENRRILKKTEGLGMTIHELPLKDYEFSIAKMAKDFYDQKFGPGIMSAQKVKEMLTDPSASNFNRLIEYALDGRPIEGATPARYPGIGFAIARVTGSFMHYSYPFYDMDGSPKDMGLGMMIRAVLSAKEAGLKYAYLGSLQRPSDTYKMQFKSFEWFDGKNWQTDLEALKQELAKA